MKTELKSSKGHQRYRKSDGTIVPGTTTITSLLNKGESLMRWHNKMGLDGIDTSKYVDKLAEVGQLAHYLIACHLKNEHPNLDIYSQEVIDKAENSFLSYLEWERQHTLETIACELPIVSERYSYGGTIDWYGNLDSTPTLIDFKTSRTIYPEHVYQAAGGYWQLALERFAVVDQTRILQIGRSEDEGFSERLIKDRRIPWRVFLHLLMIYKWQRLERRL